MSQFTNEVNIANAPIDVNVATSVPLSITGSVTTTPSGTQDVNITNASLAVTGSFYQATQPVSIALPVAVTGTFYQATQPVSIATMPTTPVTGTFWQAVQPVSGPLTDVELRATPVPVSSTPVTSSSSTVTQVVTTATNQTLLAANANRKKAILYFEGSTQYVKLGATASTSSYSYKITSNNTVLEIDTWTGQIDSMGTSGKNVLITELV